MDTLSAPGTFRRALRAWLRTNRRYAPELGDRGKPSLQAWSQRLFDGGYAGLTWPVEFGGHGYGIEHELILAEECDRAGVPEPPNIVGLQMAGPTLIQHGSAQQQRRHLEPILIGSQMFCLGFSESEAGSDLGAVRTRATRVDGGYRIDGTKLWSSYAQLADFCLVLARTDPDVGPHRGLSLLLVDLTSDGIDVTPIRQINGDENFCRIRFDRVVVGDDAVVGAAGSGWTVAMSALSHERVTLAGTLVARLATQLDRLVTSMRERGVAAEPALRHRLALLYIDVQALKATAKRTMSELVTTGRPGPQSRILKLQWSRSNQDLTALAIDVLGNDVMTVDPTAAGWTAQLLRSRGSTIEGGTTEILQSVIAEQVAGLPRTR
ncbi:acyl-CoA dehydrogenase family protein [Kribbella sp. NPDC050820]|uniref:acyl-CoA dehydrogenase family protein n=1 Tax=Kribbella sp. NPDC050820 TaxID=3155408 RepID=UPI0033C29D39